jgi:periplasmic protein TonB
MRRRLTLLLLVGAAVLSDRPATAQTTCMPQRPRYIHEPQGIFPFTMLDTGIEGRVVVRALIGTDGLPKSVDVAQSSGHAAFDTEAVRPVSRSRWQPMPCEAVMMVPINFKQYK